MGTFRELSTGNRNQTFFTQLGKLIARRFRCGVGLTAVSCSSLIGMVTGSVAANIAITGSFTIPLMKRVGYKPENAGAIEAAASNGGQIMPPIMGIAAFAMAGITGIPYWDIIRAAVLPALFYYYCCGLYVFLQAEKLKIAQVKEHVDIRELVISSYNFLVPLAVILVLLYLNYSVMFVGFWAILSSVAVGFIRKTSRPSFSKLMKAIVDGAVTGSQIAAICASIGLIAVTMTSSGLVVKLAAGIEQWSGGSLLFAMIIIALIAIVLGMGGITLTGYILISLFGAPVLMKMGVSLLQSHFFVFYISCLAFLTPPVAFAALVAARFAKADYIKTAIESCKVAFGAFLLPFTFIYCPAMLLQGQDPFLSAMDLLAAFFCLSTAQFGFTGYFLTYSRSFFRGLFLTSAGLMAIYIATKELTFFIMGIGIFAIVALYEFKNRTMRIRCVNLLK